MNQPYDLVRAREKNAKRNRAFQLQCSVIVAAFSQERNEKVMREQAEAQQAATALVRFSMQSATKVRVGQ